jgi:hypothetical protein
MTPRHFTLIDLIDEAETLTDRLYEEWRMEPRDTARCLKLVHVAQKAHRRLWRRQAASGNQLALDWMARLSTAQARRGAA